MHRNPDFYNGVKSALVLLKELCLRCRDEVAIMAEGCVDRQQERQYREMAGNLEHIAYSSPTSFWKAMLLSYL